MQLSDLKKSITELNREEALTLVLAIRKSRRTVKVKPTLRKKKTIKAKSKIDTILKSLGDKDISELINMIEGQIKE